MTVSRIFSRTGTFSGTNFFRYRYLFPGPNTFGTGTFLRAQFFPTPVPIPTPKMKISRNSPATVPIYSGTNDDFFRTRTFFRDQIFSAPGLIWGPIFFRYQTCFFSGPNFSGTGTIKKGTKFPGPGCHTLIHILIIIAISVFCLNSHFQARSYKSIDCPPSKFSTKIAP